MSLGYGLTDYMKFYETLPYAGTMRNGIIYRRDPLVRRTKERDVLLLPTLRSVDGRRPPVFSKSRAALNMLPTQLALLDADFNHDRAKAKWEKLVHVKPPEPGGGGMNPMWLEWFMGFPIGWTETQP
jgi:hypothetical protein